MNIKLRTRRMRSAVYWAIAVAAVVNSSCGTQARYAEVEGVVKINGRPMEWIEVVFMPDPAEGTKGTRASCYTDGEGRYRLRTDGAEPKGAIVGKHRVVFVDTSLVASASGGSAQDDLPDPVPVPVRPKAPTGRGVRARIADEYTSPDRTPFKGVEVREGHQTLDFDLRGVSN